MTNHPTLRHVGPSRRSGAEPPRCNRDCNRRGAQYRSIVVTRGAHRGDKCAGYGYWPVLAVNVGLRRRHAHNPKVAGSNPAPATKKTRSEAISDLVFSRRCNHFATRCYTTSATGSPMAPRTAVGVGREGAPVTAVDRDAAGRGSCPRTFEPTTRRSFDERRVTS